MHSSWDSDLRKAALAMPGKKLKTTDPTSGQRGRPTSTNPELSKNNYKEKGKNWSLVPNGCLTPRQTGQLNVGHNITLTLTLTLT
jgi:hypothetical protein